MNILRKSSSVGITGKSGTGKTSYAERYIVGAHYSRVFIYDHQDAEFSKRLNLIPCFDLDEMFDRARTERILAFDYAAAYPGQLEECFDLFCDLVFDFSGQNLNPVGYESLFVVDELQFCTGPMTMPPAFQKIVQTGRRNGVDLLWLSQQPNEIHNRVRNQCTEYVTFQMIDDRALDWAEKLGVSPEAIRELPELHYLWRNTRTGEERTGEITF